MALEKIKISKKAKSAKEKRVDLQNNLATDLASPIQNNDQSVDELSESPKRRRHRLAHKLFDSATSSNPNQGAVNKILREYSSDINRFFKVLAKICIDRTNPYSDPKWGKIRKAIGNYSQEYLKKFNAEVIKQARKRGPRTEE